MPRPRFPAGRWDPERVSTDRPPAGLSGPGRALWTATLADYTLDPAERVVLAELCRVADRLDRLAGELAAAPLTVPGSTGQQVAHPLLAEARAQGVLADRLVRVLALPPADAPVGRRRVVSAEAGAAARWGRGRAS